MKKHSLCALWLAAALAGCSSRVFVNASPVADIRTSAKVTICLPAGSRMLGAKANGICAGGAVEAQLHLRAGVPQNFRIGYGSGGGFFITPTAF